MAVVHDGTLTGTGVTGDPLKVANPFSNADETKLDGVETGAEVNVQPDWNQTDTAADSYIRNKPDPVLRATISNYTADTTLTAAIRDKVARLTGTAGATFTLPDIPAAGFAFFVCNDSTHVLTLDGNSSDTIEGEATYSLYPGHVEKLLAVSGTEWRIVGAPLFTAADRAKLDGLTFDRELGVYDYRTSGSPTDVPEGQFDIINQNVAAHRQIYIHPHSEHEAFFFANWHVGFQFYVGDALLEIAPYVLPPTKLGNGDYRAHYTIVSGSLPANNATDVRFHTPGDIPYEGDLATVARTGSYDDLTNKVAESSEANAKAGTDGSTPNASRMTPRRTKAAIEALAVVPADFKAKDTDHWFSVLGAHSSWSQASHAKGAISYYTGTPGADTILPLVNTLGAVDASTITRIRMSKFAYPDANFLGSPTAAVAQPSGTLHQHPDQPARPEISASFVIGTVSSGGSGDTAYWEIDVTGSGNDFWAGTNLFVRSTDEVPGLQVVPGNQVAVDDTFVARLRRLSTFAAAHASSLATFMGTASAGRMSLVAAFAAFFVKRLDLTGASGDSFATWATTADFLAATDRRGLWSIATNASGAPQAANSQALSAVADGNGTVLLGATRTDVEGDAAAYGSEPAVADYPIGTVLYFGPWLPYAADYYVKVTTTAAGAKVGTGSAAYVHYPISIDVVGTAPADADYFRRSSAVPSGLAGKLPWSWIVAPPWVRRSDLETKETDFWGLFEGAMLESGATDRRGDWTMVSTGTGAPSNANAYANVPAIQAGARTLVVGGSMYAEALSTNPDVNQVPDKAIAANDLLGLSHMHLSEPYDKDNYIRFTPTGAPVAVGSGNGSYSYVHGTVEIIGTLVGGTGWMFMDRPPPDLEFHIPWEWVDRPPWLKRDQLPDHTRTSVRDSANAQDTELATELGIRKAIDGHHANLSDFPPITYTGFTIDTSGIDASKEIRKVGTEWQVNPGNLFTDFRAKIVPGTRVAIRKDGSNIETGVVYSSYVSGSSVHFTLSEDALTGSLPNASTVSITLTGHLVAWDDVLDEVRDADTASTAKVVSEKGIRDSMLLRFNTTSRRFEVNMQQYTENRNRHISLGADVGSPHGLVVVDFPSHTHRMMWVIDRADDYAYAWKLHEDGSATRAETYDFALDTDNDAPVGACTDGDHIWIGDNGEHKAFAYAVSQIENTPPSRDSARDFDFDTNNQNATSLGTDGTVIWVMDSSDGKGYAYLIPNSGAPTRAQAKDLDYDSAIKLPHGVSFEPDGILHIIDATTDKAYGYTVSNSVGTRAPEHDFQLTPLFNVSPTGADTDGDSVFVVDNANDAVYVYEVPKWRAIIVADKQRTLADLYGPRFLTDYYINGSVATYTLDEDHWSSAGLLLQGARTADAMLIVPHWPQGVHVIVNDATGDYAVKVKRRGQDDTAALTLESGVNLLVQDPDGLEFLQIAKATTSRRGSVRLATNARAITGTNSEDAVTPAAMQAARPANRMLVAPTDASADAGKVNALNSAGSAYELQTKPQIGRFESGDIGNTYVTLAHSGWTMQGADGLMVTIHGSDAGDSIQYVGNIGPLRWDNLIAGKDYRSPKTAEDEYFELRKQSGQIQVRLSSGWSQLVNVELTLMRAG